jgi:hypothetical protein
VPTRSLHTTMPTGTDGNDFTAPDHLPLLGAMCPRCLCGWQPAAIRSRRLHQRPGNVGRVFGGALGGVGAEGGAPATARPPPSPGRLVRGGWCKGLRDKTGTTQNPASPGGGGPMRGWHAIDGPVWPALSAQKSRLRLVRLSVKSTMHRRGELGHWLEMKGPSLEAADFSYLPCYLS